MGSVTGAEECSRRLENGNPSVGEGVVPCIIRWFFLTQIHVSCGSRCMLSTKQLHRYCPKAGLRQAAKSTILRHGIFARHLHLSPLEQGVQ